MGEKSKDDTKAEETGEKSGDEEAKRKAKGEQTDVDQIDEEQSGGEKGKVGRGESGGEGTDGEGDPEYHRNVGRKTRSGFDWPGGEGLAGYAMSRDEFEMRKQRQLHSRRTRLRNRAKMKQGQDDDVDDPDDPNNPARREKAPPPFMEQYIEKKRVEHKLDVESHWNEPDGHEQESLDYLTYFDTEDAEGGTNGDGSMYANRYDAENRLLGPDGLPLTTELDSYIHTKDWLNGEFDRTKYDEEGRLLGPDGNPVRDSDGNYVMHDEGLFNYDSEDRLLDRDGVPIEDSNGNHILKGIVLNSKIKENKWDTQGRLIGTDGRPVRYPDGKFVHNADFEPGCTDFCELDDEGRVIGPGGQRLHASDGDYMYVNPGLDNFDINGRLTGLDGKPVKKKNGEFVYKTDVQPMQFPEPDDEQDDQKDRVSTAKPESRVSRRSALSRRSRGSTADRRKDEDEPGRQHMQYDLDDPMNALSELLKKRLFEEGYYFKDGELKRDKTLRPVRYTKRPMAPGPRNHMHRGDMQSSRDGLAKDKSFLERILQERRSSEGSLGRASSASELRLQDSDDDDGQDSEYKKKRMYRSQNEDKMFWKRRRRFPPKDGELSPQHSAHLPEIRGANRGRDSGSKTYKSDPDLRSNADADGYHDDGKYWHLLEELYTDKKYLDRLMENIDQETNEEVRVNESAERGVISLKDLAHVWSKQVPIGQRPFLPPETWQWYNYRQGQFSRLPKIQTAEGAEETDNKRPISRDYNRPNSREGAESRTSGQYCSSPRPESRMSSEDDLNSDRLERVTSAVSHYSRHSIDSEHTRDDSEHSRGPSRGPGSAQRRNHSRHSHKRDSNASTETDGNSRTRARSPFSVTEGQEESNC